jgi:predicted O-methyltransferase YrrM
MTNEEIKTLVDKYWGEYTFPEGFEHRFDPDSSAVMYSLIRQYKPVSVLAIGCWLGGSTCVIMSALQKNKKDFNYVASELLDDKREETRKNVLSKCNQAPILVGDIMENLDSVPKKLDFLFIDTNHDREVTQWIVDNIFPRVQKGALIAIHDFAVEEIDGKWVGKGEGGIGGLPETELYMDMFHGGKWPFKKLYWTYHNPFREGMNPNWEGSFWEA